jgi:hypothetical protein
MSFRITGLPAEDFAHLFALSDEELAAQGVYAGAPTRARPAIPAGSV